MVNAGYLAQPRLKLLDESRRVVRVQNAPPDAPAARRGCSRTGTGPPAEPERPGAGRQVPRPAEREGHRLPDSQDRRRGRPHHAAGGRIEPTVVVRRYSNGTDLLMTSFET
jgi:hypothetical protein